MLIVIYFFKFDILRGVFIELLNIAKKRIKFINQMENSILLLQNDIHSLSLAMRFATQTAKFYKLINSVNEILNFIWIKNSCLYKVNDI